MRPILKRLISTTTTHRRTAPRASDKRGLVELQNRVQTISAISAAETVESTAKAAAVWQPATVQFRTVVA